MIANEYAGIPQSDCGLHHSKLIGRPVFPTALGTTAEVHDHDELVSSL
jgi:hypothetical protein